MNETSLERYVISVTSLFLKPLEERAAGFVDWQDRITCMEM